MRNEGNPPSSGYRFPTELMDGIRTLRCTLRSHSVIRRCLINVRFRGAGLLVGISQCALTFQRPQGAADAGHDGFPGALLRAWVDHFEAMDRVLDVGRRIAPAVEDQPVALGREREERWRDP